MITDKKSISIGKLCVIWLTLGLIAIVCGIEYIKFANLSPKLASVNEIIRLITGSVFFLGGIFALSMVGINFKTVQSVLKSDIKLSIKFTLKYFFIYAAIATMVITVLYLLFILLMKLDLFTMSQFNSLHANLTIDKLAGKSYFKNIIIQSPIKFIIYLFSTCVLIPIEEEIFMRRFLYVSLRHKMNFYSALIISSLVFGIAHMGGAMAPAFFGGLFLSWIYERHQNLLINIMVHGLINFLVILSMIFIGT